jgi:hypothetical protein
MRLQGIYVFVLIVFLNTALAQVSFKYGVEMGYGFAPRVEHPHQEYKNDRGDAITEDHSNASGPVVGLAGDLLVGKHLRFSFGAQYQKLNSHYHKHIEGYDLYLKDNYRSDEFIDQSFSNLCFPVSVGVTAKIWKFSPTFFIGTRPNYILNGYYSSNYTVNDDLDSMDYHYQQRFDPSNPKQTSAPRKKLVLQGIKAGVSVFIGKWVKLTYYRCAGGGISYSFGAMSCFGYSCYNYSHVVSLTLFVPQKKKSNLECKLIHKKSKGQPLIQ